MPALAALATAAGLLHIWNHALMKGLMFLAAGSVLHGTGTKDMEKLGGLMKRMPWTGAAMMAGAVAISALPPLNGFVSEWLLYLSLMKCGLETSGGRSLDGPPGGWPGRAGRRPGRRHVRTPDGHRAPGFAAERSGRSCPRVFAPGCSRRW